MNPGQEIGHRLRHRGETAGREPVAAVRVDFPPPQAVLPGPTAEEALGTEAKLTGPPGG
jgi:hypothetical protein